MMKQEDMLKHENLRWSTKTYAEAGELTLRHRKFRSIAGTPILLSSTRFKVARHHYPSPKLHIHCVHPQVAAAGSCKWCFFHQMYGLMLLCLWNDSSPSIKLLSCSTFHTTLIFPHQTFSFVQDWNLHWKDTDLQVFQISNWLYAQWCYVLTTSCSYYMDKHLPRNFRNKIKKLHKTKKNEMHMCQWYSHFFKLVGIYLAYQSHFIKEHMLFKNTLK